MKAVERAFWLLFLVFALVVWQLCRAAVALARTIRRRRPLEPAE
jgi:hypothetical protein